MKMKFFIYLGVVTTIILIITCGFAFANEDSSENNINFNIIGNFPFGDAIEVKNVDAKATVSHIQKKAKHMVLKSQLN